MGELGDDDLKCKPCRNSPGQQKDLGITPTGAQESSARSCKESSTHRGLCGKTAHKHPTEGERGEQRSREEKHNKCDKVIAWWRSMPLCTFAGTEKYFLLKCGAQRFPANELFRKPDPGQSECQKHQKPEKWP